MTEQTQIDTLCDEIGNAASILRSEGFGSAADSLIESANAALGATAAPAEQPNSSNTLGGFAASFYDDYKRQPTSQECFDAGRRSGLGVTAAPAEPTIQDCLTVATPTQPVQQNDWQPIESAPRDGTAVLVMRDLWPGTSTGRAEECNEHNAYVAAFWQGEGFSGKWVCYMDRVQEPYCPIDPTHWMPLPAPPAITSPKEPT